jgi:hypothetical protein
VDAKATTDASVLASQATAKTMENFSLASKVLPIWARIPLQVAPGAAGLAGEVAGTLVATGAFK